MMNKDEYNEYQRLRRQKTGNATTKKYEKTKNGFLMRLYRNMQSRIEGVQKEKFYLYEGKCLISRNDFYEWAKNNEQFHLLFENYELNNYDRKLAPSVDRINSKFGYELSNIEFVTLSENCRRSNINKKGELNPLFGRTHNHAIKKPILKFDLDMVLLQEFDSLSSAAESMNVTITAIGVASKKHTKCKGFYWRYKL